MHHHIKNCSSSFLFLLPVSIGLLLELNYMGFGIRIDTRVVLPYVAIVLVMLVGVNIFSSGLLLPSFYDRKVQQAVLAGFDDVEVIAVVGGWALRLFQLWFGLLIKADIFGDGSLDITHRVHDVDIAQIHALFPRFLPSSCPRHVHHALALAGRHHRGMFAQADHVRMDRRIDQPRL